MTICSHRPCHDLIKQAHTRQIVQNEEMTNGSQIQTGLSHSRYQNELNVMTIAIVKAVKDIKKPSAFFVGLALFILHERCRLKVLKLGSAVFS